MFFRLKADTPDEKRSTGWSLEQLRNRTPDVSRSVQDAAVQNNSSKSPNRQKVTSIKKQSGSYEFEVHCVLQNREKVKGKHDL